MTGNKSTKGKALKVTSNFALLDVKNGRAALLRRVDARHRIPVVIHGYVVRNFGNDDGVSTEFEIDVQSVEMSDAGRAA